MSTPPSAAPARAHAEPAAPPAGDSARFWDRLARKYAAHRIADLAGYERTLDRVRGLLGPTDDVLEVGCGTGTTALRLASATRHWLATDVSPEMIAIAREKLAADPCRHLRFEVADAETPLAPPASLGAVLAFNLLHLVPDLDRALGVLVPMLKPGGLFISKTPCLAEMNPLITRVAVPLLRAIGKAPAVLSFDAAGLQAAFERQGLAIETVERHGSKRRDPRVFVVARRTP
jgi:ubiquinone/menaquinone biosynthesis C-methylase UbiE